MGVMMSWLLALWLLSSTCDCRVAKRDPQANCPLSPHAESELRVVRAGCLFGYVVDSASAEKFYSGGWEPDDAVLLGFEGQLSKTGFAVPDSYGRHYVGVHVNGERAVLVTFFCDHEYHWHRAVAAPADGYPCYLSAHYLINSRTIAPHWHHKPG